MLYADLVKIREVFDKLKERGWVLDRIRGSHHVFVHPKAKRSVVVPVHDKDIPDFYAKSIFKQAERATKE